MRPTIRTLFDTFAALVLALCLVVSPAALAQEAPLNSTFIGNFDQSGQRYADVWGDGNFAYLAHFGQQIVDIIDLSDPQNPVVAATYNSGIPSASAQDVKVHDGLMFVGLESVAPGCHIVDVRDPFAPVLLTEVSVLSAVHNVFFDEGWLYLVDSSQNLIEIVDLRDYDPDNPPAEISTSTWTLTNVGNQFVHDITVQNGRLYASAWDSLRVFDVSNVANEMPPLLGFASADNVHASWATDDGRFVVVGEEDFLGGLTLYEVFDEGESVRLEVRDYFFLSSLRAGSAHNPLIVGNRVYVSWYASGIQVLEIDPKTATWSLVASFDTTPADGDDNLFAGCWGVYPFLGPDRVLASDGQTGLWVVDVEPQLLRFKYPNGLPRVVEPNVATPIEVEIDPVGSPTDAASAMRHAAINGGAPVSQTLVDEGEGLFSGTLPAAACGSVLEVSFSADNTLGTTFVDPPGAPAETYRIDVAADTETIFEDDFELDFGWTVTNTSLEDGSWERGDPLGTGAQPENDATGAGDGSCFFTAQGSVGGDVSEADVDGGPTVVTSPPMDFSSGGIVSYSYWVFNDDEETQDALVVEISSDGTNWVEARRYDGLLGGWREDRFDSADFVGPSDQTQVRFSIADNPNSSITEAAIDSFRAFQLICDSTIFTDGFESGNTSAWSQTIP